VLNDLIFLSSCGFCYFISDKDDFCINYIVPEDIATATV